MQLFEEYPCLEDDCVILKKITAENREELDAFRKNSRVYRYLPTFLYEQKYENVETVLERMDAECFDTGESILLGVFLKDNPSKLIGIAEIYNYEAQKEKASIGCRLSDAYWGQGIAARVVELLKAYLTGTLQLRTVTAHIMKANAASEKVVSKCGFLCLYPDLPEDWGFPEPVLTDKYVYKKRWENRGDGAGIE